MRRGLSTRERRLLLLAGLVIACVGIIQFALLPPMASRQGSIAAIAKVDAVLAMIDTLPAPSPGSGPQDPPPLRSRVTESVQQAGLDIRRIDPQGATALAVSFEDVPFADVIGWLEQMTGQGRVRVLSAEIGRRPEPGIVTARFLLEDR